MADFGVFCEISGRDDGVVSERKTSKVDMEQSDFENLRVTKGGQGFESGTEEDAEVI